MMERSGGRRIWNGLLPLLGVHVASEYLRLNRKPPVTAGLILANSLIYLRPSFLRNLLPTIDDVFFNPHLVIQNKDVKRYFLSVFYHMGEPHLVYNMMSLLWKGIQLETFMGSIEFASMVIELVTLSQGFSLLLAKALFLLFNYDKAYYREFSVGFSGVLFAMKVVLNSRSDEDTYVHGLIVPARYSAWVELILIQLFVPGVSFLGHLGGILAGFFYLWLRRSNSGQGLISTIISSFTKLCRWPLHLIKNMFLPAYGRRISGRSSDYRENRVERLSNGGGFWRCAACTYDNSTLLGACEMCGTMRSIDRTSSIHSTDSVRNLSLEELRQRRIERFAR